VTIEINASHVAHRMMNPFPLIVLHWHLPFFQTTTMKAKTLLLTMLLVMMTMMTFGK
jgi:hypothetical protein